MSSGWHKFPEERPDKLDGDYVITITEGASSVAFFAFWQAFITEDGVEERFCGYERESLPSSFYWIELPETPQDTYASCG